jgi:WS/DGAT/MGAT family acyltransferase
LAGLGRAPRSPLNVPIGPHRRYTWVDADLARFKTITSALGGTINEAVLAAVALALGRWMRARGENTEGVVLKALVPVSVRAADDHEALGNRVVFVRAPLPVGVRDPVDCLAEIHAALDGLRQPGHASAAETVSRLADLTPPAVMAQASRLQVRRRLFNLVVTNVPGPREELFLLGRPLRGLYPVVPLAQGQALGIAVMSYHGRLGFGLLGDFDALPDLDDVAAHLAAAIDELARVAGLRGPVGPAAGRRTRPPSK